MGATHFSGVCVKPSAPLTASAITLNPDLHAGKTLVLDRAAGQTFTLPAATGSGDSYRFFVKTGITSNTTVVQVASGSDWFNGSLTVAAATTVQYITANTGTPATEGDTITMNGTTTGGEAGSWIEVQDVAPNVWSLDGVLTGSGTTADPLSVAV